MKVPIRAGLIAALAVAVVASPAVASPPIALPVAVSTIGAPGVGDPFFPLAGNGGIDVSDYNLDLAYDPAVRRLEGTATLQVLATQDLSRFDLDLRGPVLGKLPAMVSFLEDLYGPYPFESVGAIVDNAPEPGYPLETQTKPVFEAAPDEATLLHELSHMWSGDAVTLRTWPDIWLHEGFATWSEWIWTERQGGQSAAKHFKQLASTPAKDTSFWNPPPGDPGDPADLFAGSVYGRGAMTLEELRERIGDPRFFTVMRRWYAEHRYGNVSTPEFIALAEKVSGQDLGAFFNVWLYQPGKPAGLGEGTPTASIQRH
jgi:hypothetical protein